MELKADLLKSKKRLEDILSGPVYGYRAGFSVSNDIVKIVEDSGYLYDSSFNSFSVNKRYGYLELDGLSHNRIPVKISETFYELPISNLRLGDIVFPWGGGGYFRLIPPRIFNLGILSMLRKGRPYLFYLHPWKLTQGSPG
jgi:hypothetical protein